MKTITAVLIVASMASSAFVSTYPVVDTGQDAHHSINPSSYMDNGNGTISDEAEANTGLKLRFGASTTIHVAPSHHSR